MKKITFRVITILVVVSVAIFACSCVKKTGSFNPIYSSGYKSFESLQKEYENKKSKFSKRARELHDAISPGVADIDYSKTLDMLDSFYACYCIFHIRLKLNFLFKSFFRIKNAL